MNIKDIVDSLVDRALYHMNPETIDAHAALDEIVSSYINTATYDVHDTVLDELGEVDMSDPRPDLTVGWMRIREQLAYTALAIACRARLAERSDNVSDEDIEALHNQHTADGPQWDPQIVDLAAIALGTYDGTSEMSPNEARIYCAAMLNARAKGTR